MWTVTDPAEILHRLATGQCLSCSFKGLNVPSQIDPETGFFYRHCASCRDDLARHKPPKAGPSDAKWKRDHRQEGLDNLDRLMGNSYTGTPVNLRCPSCDHVWHAATIGPHDESTPETVAAQCYCRQCQAPPPMAIV